MTVYLGWLLVVLGAAQLYAGAGGVSRACIRIGATLVTAGLVVVVLSAAHQVWCVDQ